MRVFLAVLAFLASMLLMYLGVAFAAWDLNPGHWSSIDRSGMIIFGLAIGAGAALLALVAERP